MYKQLPKRISENTNDTILVLGNQNHAIYRHTAVVFVSSDKNKTQLINAADYQSITL